MNLYGTVADARPNPPNAVQTYTIGVSAPDRAPVPAQPVSATIPARLYRVEDGVSAPQLLYAPDPQFNDQARRNNPWDSTLNIKSSCPCRGGNDNVIGWHKRIHRDMRPGQPCEI